MFLKIVSPNLRLPHIVTQQAKAFLFPKVAELPSVCIEAFTKEGGAQLLAKAPAVFQEATKQEVNAAIDVSKKLRIVDTVPVIGMQDTDVIANTVTVADFTEFTVDEAAAFLAETALQKDVAVKLLASLQVKEGKDVKKLVRVVQEYVDGLK